MTDIITIIWIVAGIIIAIFLFNLIKGYISIYNKFVYWITKVNRKFADIDVIMSQRVDMINALAQVVKKYSIHEYKTIKDTIEARSRWSKDASINDKVKAVENIEHNFIKLQAIFERYPRIKADALYKSIMGHGNISRIESKLRDFRLGYNYVVQCYNERVARFPRNIVARIHGFKQMPYLNLGNSINQGTQEQYKPKKIFED